MDSAITGTPDRCRTCRGTVHRERHAVPVSSNQRLNIADFFGACMKVSKHVSPASQPRASHVNGRACARSCEAADRPDGHGMPFTVNVHGEPCPYGCDTGFSKSTESRPILRGFVKMLAQLVTSTIGCTPARRMISAPIRSSGRIFSARPARATKPGMPQTTLLASS